MDDSCSNPLGNALSVKAIPISGEDVVIVTRTRPSPSSDGRTLTLAKTDCNSPAAVSTARPSFSQDPPSSRATTSSSFNFNLSDRNRLVQGKSVAVRVDLGCHRIFKKKKRK